MGVVKQHFKNKGFLIYLTRVCSVLSPNWIIFKSDTFVFLQMYLSGAPHFLTKDCVVC